jgi:1,4-alpha-glucan branching enzyme
MPAYLAVVLHAHLPYVRHPEHARSLEERWLFEALWESYLPLLAVLDRLADDHLTAPFSLSLSPTLLSMLRDDLLLRRFEDHLARLAALAARVDALSAGTPFAAAAAFYRAKLASSSRAWTSLHGDLPAALLRHAEAGRIELLTTAATHAYLPGLLPGAPASLRAQLHLGPRAFAALTGAPAPSGFWLPECAYDPRLDPLLAAAALRFTVVDAHAFELADPAPPAGASSPVRSPSGVAFFARDRASAREVWSRDAGYPGHPAYREFYRDVGFDLPEPALAGEIGPGGTRLTTGLKLHRVTGPGPDKAPYDPARASAQARAHAAEFVARREAHLAALAHAGAAPILVAPYDAELFGHFWLEGPEFLEHALRGLAASPHVTPTTLGAYLDRHPPVTVAQPAASTWGEGGFGAVWTGPRAAPLWRHVHHAERAVLEALSRRPDAAGAPGRALDQALRELLLLQSSDWAFMIDRGEMAPYAESRVRGHAARALRLAAMARQGAPSEGDLAWLDAVRDRDRFLEALAGPALRAAFRPLAAPPP